MFDGWSNSSRIIKLKGRESGCAVCGTEPTIRSIEQAGTYSFFCGVSVSGSSEADGSEGGGGGSLSVSARFLADLMKRENATSQAHVLVDVREPVQFDICSLPGALNLPMSQLEKRLPQLRQALKDLTKDGLQSASASVYVVCRRGVFSRSAAKRLRAALEAESAVRVFNVAGGLESWAKQVDSSFPLY